MATSDSSEDDEPTWELTLSGVIENGAFMDARAIRDVEFGGEGQDHA